MLRPPVNSKFIPNVTQVPNVIIDSIMRTVTPAEFKVLVALSRKTFGWGQTQEYISTSQFVSLTGLTDTGVSKALKSLQEKGLVNKISEGGGRASNCWSMSLDVAFRTYPSGRRYVLNSAAIPNVIFDEIMAQISPAEFKALLLIARKTYGFHKDTDHIARSQFTLFTGLSEPGIKKVLKSLQEKELIICLKNGGGRTISEWTINTHYFNSNNSAPNLVSPSEKAKTVKTTKVLKSEQVPSNRVSPNRVSGSSEQNISELPAEYPSASNSVSPQNKPIKITVQNNLDKTYSLKQLKFNSFTKKIQTMATEIAKQKNKQNNIDYILGVCRNLKKAETEIVDSNIDTSPQNLNYYTIRYQYANKVYLELHNNITLKQVENIFLEQGLEPIAL